jgi:fumarate hydratase class II
VTAGEERQLGRYDDGDTGAHVVALDERRMPDTYSRHVGDRVHRPGSAFSDRDPEVSRPHVASKLDLVAETDTNRELWGAETTKAIANFPVSGEPIPHSVARWLGRIKAAAARVNAELGLLDEDKAQRIAEAGDRVAAGEVDDQFPIDVFQTGSGTSSNMNANEVIASLAGDDVHANDDVNLGQSSNDVFPSAVHLAAVDQITNELLPALQRLADSLQAKAAEFDDVVKSGRTHLMDAVPVTLGQEFGGYAAQVRQGFDRVGSTLERLGQIPLGGTAVGTGLNTHPEFAARVRNRLSEETGLTISPPADPFEAQAARDALVETSGALKTIAVSLTKIANDLRLMGSGPRAGLAEIFLPELQKGSSIMPGKVNPVIPEVVTQVAAQVIGNDVAITAGGMQGHFELNVFVPMLARNLLDSIKLLAAASRLLAEKCVDGIEANREVCERYAELTLSAATALNPYVGYDAASEIVTEAASSGRPLREIARERGVPEDVLIKALDYRGMAKPQGG